MSVFVFRWAVPAGVGLLALGLVAYSAYRDDLLNLPGDPYA